MPFGLFLIDTGAITPSQLVTALDQQHHDQIPIGELAIAKGYLTYRDIERVLANRVGDYSPEFFGDVAVEFGLLSRPQVEGLLRDQRETRKPLGECLVEKGVITRAELEKARREYRLECTT